MMLSTIPLNGLVLALNINDSYSGVYIGNLFLYAQSEFRSCVKVEVAVLGFPSLISLAVSVDVKQH